MGFERSALHYVVHPAVLVNLHFVYYTRTTRTFDCNKNYCCNANERYLRIVSTVAKRISFWKPCQKKEKTKKAGDKNPKKRFVFNRHALLLFLLLCNVVVTVVRDEKRKVVKFFFSVTPWEVNGGDRRRVSMCRTPPKQLGYLTLPKRISDCNFSSSWYVLLFS